jgi:hypothetical protein
MRTTTPPTIDPYIPVWPEGFPEEPTVACEACGAEVVLETPRDFTVRHHPRGPGDPEPKRVPETGAYVAADASGTVPFDPEGERFIVEFACPACGAYSTAEV